MSRAMPTVRELPRARHRKGAAMVETTIVLMVLLTLIFGMIDLGFAVFRYTVVSQVARQVARQAIVRGAMATKLGPWGPSTYSGRADGKDPVATLAAPYTAGLDPSQTTIRIEWPDGGNKPEQTVRVTITSTHQPMVAFVFGSTSFNVTAVSTMQIAH